MAQVTLQGVKKTYDNKVAVIHGIDIDIKDGEFIVIVGPSGCGKSTLLRMLAGFESPTSGAIRFRARMEHPLTAKLLATAAAQANTTAPDFEWKEADGKATTLAKQAATKPVLLYFIEKECPCSRDAAVYIDQLQAAFSGPGGAEMLAALNQAVKQSLSGGLHLVFQLSAGLMIASISTSAPRGRLATPTAARAGYGSLKYFAITSLTRAKFARSVR